MKSKKVKKNVSFVFTQGVTPYRKEILISVGASPSQVLRYVKKSYRKEKHEDFEEIIKQHSELFDKLEDKSGYAIHFEKKPRKYLVLLLRPFEDVWDYYECLVHELSHIIDWIVEDCMLEKETEARAYLHEHLFRSIRRKLRRKLQGID